MAGRRLRLLTLCVICASAVPRASAGIKPRGRVVACLVMAAPGIEGASYRVEDTEQHSNALRYTSRLSFVLATPAGAKTVFVYKTYDTLITLHGGPESSRIATVWESGSALWTRVFDVSGPRIRMVLERGSHLPPEFTLDGILINAGWVPVGERCCTAERTEIWTWMGDKYQLTATVPFDQRYEALAKLGNESMKK